LSTFGLCSGEQEPNIVDRPERGPNIVDRPERGPNMAAMNSRVDDKIRRRPLGDASPGLAAPGLAALLEGPPVGRAEVRRAAGNERRSAPGSVTGARQGRLDFCSQQVATQQVAAEQVAAEQVAAEQVEQAEQVRAPEPTKRPRVLVRTTRLPAPQPAIRRRLVLAELDLAGAGQVEERPGDPARAGGLRTEGLPRADQARPLVFELLGTAFVFATFFAAAVLL
jgi:hypothetical protein